MMTGDEYCGEDEDAYDDHQEADERSNNLSRQLIYGDARSERCHVMDIRTHAPLEKIAMFEGKCYRSEETL